MLCVAWSESTPSEAGALSCGGGSSSISTSTSNGENHINYETHFQDGVDGGHVMHADKTAGNGLGRDRARRGARSAQDRQERPGGQKHSRGRDRPFLKDVPTNPGVYIMKNSDGKTIYIGKAKNLRKRVRSYFAKRHDNYKTQRLVELVSDIEFIITDTEGEAFLLESNMIKQYRPRFNIELKDQQRYTYLRLTDEKYPRLLVARRTRDGKFLGKGEIFGPFVHGSSKLLTVGALRKSFQIRICKTLPKKVCLEYHLGNCEGPCELAGAQARYAGHVAALRDVLSGSDQMKVFAEKLSDEMQEAADAQQFERAIELRDTLARLGSLQSDQKMEYVKSSDEEYFGIGIANETAVVMTFRMIHGVIRDSEKFFFDAMADNSFAEFLYQYYTTHRIPRFVVLSEAPQDADLLQSLLSERAGFAVRMIIPQRGKRKQMIDLIMKNIRIIHEKVGSGEVDAAGAYGHSPAVDAARSDYGGSVGGDGGGDVARNGADTRGAGVRHPHQGASTFDPALAHLQKLLGLPRIPYVIECFDVSNHGESFAVGSMSRFVNGTPDKSGYRKFRIKTVVGRRDDYAMISEIVHRRYRRILAENPAVVVGSTPGCKNPDNADSGGRPALPDLVLIDGGRGQLNAALQSLHALKLYDLPCASLAKENEDVFLPEVDYPITIPKSKQSLKILQYARDEAHRFGVAYNHTLQKKLMKI